MAYDAAMDKLSQMKRRPFLVPLLLPVMAFVALATAVAWFVDARHDDRDGHPACRDGVIDG